jgi:hypothetical protein
LEAIFSGKRGCCAKNATPGDRNAENNVVSDQNNNVLKKRTLFVSRTTFFWKK